MITSARAKVHDMLSKWLLFLFLFSSLSLLAGPTQARRGRHFRPHQTSGLACEQIKRDSIESSLIVDRLAPQTAIELN